jgi:hypothetical protein
MVSQESLVRQIRQEFREMPGLCLTLSQVRRLWRMDDRTCRAVIERLVAEGFLQLTPTGACVSAGVTEARRLMRPA